MHGFNTHNMRKEDFITALIIAGKAMFRVNAVNIKYSVKYKPGASS